MPLIHFRAGWGRAALEKRSMAVRSSSVSSSKLWGMFGLIILLQYDSVSIKIKPEGVACLCRVEWYFSLVRVESILWFCAGNQESQNIPTTMFHCGLEHCAIILSPACLLMYTLLFHMTFLPVIHCLILVFLFPPQVFGLVSSPENCLRNSYSSSKTTTKQSPFDKTFALYI